jgi:hypothetical protein
MLSKEQMLHIYGIWLEYPMCLYGEPSLSSKKLFMGYKKAVGKMKKLFNKISWNATTTWKSRLSFFLLGEFYVFGGRRRGSRGIFKKSLVWFSAFRRFLGVLHVLGVWKSCEFE